MKWAQERLVDGTDYARKRYAAAQKTYRLAACDAEAALINPNRDDEPTWPTSHEAHSTCRRTDRSGAKPNP